MIILFTSSYFISSTFNQIVIVNCCMSEIVVSKHI